MFQRCTSHGLLKFHHRTSGGFWVAVEGKLKQTRLEDSLNVQKECSDVGGSIGWGNTSTALKNDFKDSSIQLHDTDTNFSSAGK